MKITVTTLAEYIFVLDVGEDLELEHFKIFCEEESGFPAGEIAISFNGRPLTDDKKSLKQYGMVDGDAVSLQHVIQQSAAVAAAAAPRRPVAPCKPIIDFSCIEFRI